MVNQIDIQWNNIHLAASVHFPSSYYNEIKQSSKVYPLFIICHGFVGSRIGVNRLFVKAAEELSSHEAIVVRFDYAGCGESEGNYGEQSLDDLISQTKTIIDYALSIEQVDSNKLILIGHSLGGAVCTLTAATDHRVKKLILWSAVGNPYKDIVSIVGEDTYKNLEVAPKIDYLGYSLTKKFFLSLSNYLPLEEASKFNGDVLVLHGTSDEEIPVGYSFQYEYVFNSRNSSACKKQVISGADHTYSSGSSYEQLIQHTNEWLYEQFVFSETNYDKIAVN